MKLVLNNQKAFVQPLVLLSKQRLERLAMEQKAMVKKLAWASQRLASNEHLKKHKLKRINGKTNLAFASKKANQAKARVKVTTNTKWQNINVAKFYKLCNKVHSANDVCFWLSKTKNAKLYLKPEKPGFDTQTFAQKAKSLATSISANPNPIEFPKLPLLLPGLLLPSEQKKQRQLNPTNLKNFKTQPTGLLRLCFAGPSPKPVYESLKLLDLLNRTVGCRLQLNQHLVLPSDLCLSGTFGAKMNPKEGKTPFWSEPETLNLPKRQSQPAQIFNARHSQCWTSVISNGHCLKLKNNAIKTKALFTVIRSPFVYKKTREQFGLNSISCVVKLAMTKPQQILFIQYLCITKFPAELKINSTL